MNAIKFPNDSGPIYLETLEGRLPVEPFNTFSNLIFLALIVYWGIKVYRDPKQHRFLAWVLPIIGISYVGGTIYHATRSHEFWLRLDWMPIMFLCASLVIYFIFKLVHSWGQRLLWIIVLLGASFLLRILPIPSGLRVSLGYIITAATILVPITWYLVKTKGENWGLVAIAFLIFGIAIFFRSIDIHQNFFPMGTHWLWHLLGGIAVHFLIRYIFEDNLLNLSANSVSNHD
ncbi:MAG: ceramidase [Flavobacteriaceae bacterium]|nr:ceramidase [Flavobacteriaceae bacterium]